MLVAGATPYVSKGVTLGEEEAIAVAHRLPFEQRRADLRKLCQWPHVSL